ncbi:hypothetical protein [Clostridium sp.]|uniref:hypothetical protein n=1 Tax=Clostridium sp. TaxID=1506 RepID=UPI001A58DCD2|nr:hypothetical protein [Clostridium sp.]MBK5240243.1 hypothetical protein [Clostridium sp.]
MAQGIFGGATSYEEQSIGDILSDIKSWIEYTQSVQTSIKKGIEHFKKCKFWGKVSYNFKMTLVSTIGCQNTYLEDFCIIVKSIEGDKITQKEASLLRKIGKTAIDFNHEYGRNWNEDDRWKEYGDPDFRIVEELYADGRDYFVSLQDASNASSRLVDYISTLPPITNNSINQHITGDKNIVSGINNGHMNFVNHYLIDFNKESKGASITIDKLEGVDQDIKEYIVNLLKEANEAIENKNKEKQESAKLDYKGFVAGAGVKAFKVIGVLSSFASIASFFGITM